MIRENRQLVTDEQVEFEKLPVDVQDCRTITDHFRGTYRIYPSLTKENRRMWTCNRSDLQTLGSQLVMPKNLPDHWLVEFEKWPDVVQGLRKMSDQCVRNLGNILWMYKESSKDHNMLYWVDLETLGFWPFMPTNLSGPTPNQGT